MVDPEKRLKTKDIFIKHKKFFDKAQGEQYIYGKLLKDLPPISERIPENVVQKGEDFVAKLE